MTSPQSSRWLTAGIVTALLVSLTACSQGGEPAAAKKAPRPTASPVSDYTPPSTPPRAVPVESPDKTLAAAFVLAWFETLNYGYTAGDADPLRASVGIGCFTCMNWITEVQTQSDRDLRRTSGFVHVRDLAYLGPEGGDFLFRARLDREPGVVTAPDGTQTALAVGQEVVDLKVGLSSSSLTNKTAWSMKSVTTPAG